MRLLVNYSKWKVLGVNCVLAFATLNKGLCLIKEYSVIKLFCNGLCLSLSMCEARAKETRLFRPRVCSSYIFKVCYFLLRIFAVHTTVFKCGLKGACKAASNPFGAPASQTPPNSSRPKPSPASTHTKLTATARLSKLLRV